MQTSLLWTAIWSLVLPPALSVPALLSNETDLVSEDFNFVGSLSGRSLANSVQLRIQCLGASVVNGAGSTSGNGFRYALRNQLLAGGNPVNFIGSQTSGTMVDNEVWLRS
jgi:hypothetical protein